MAFQAGENTWRPSRRRLLEGSAFLAVAAAASVPIETADAAPISDPMRPVPIPTQVAAKRGTANVAGTSLTYWDTGGSGIPVVLLHPASGSADVWPYQQPVFANAGYRVMAYSRRGYGGSAPVPDVNPGVASDDLRQLLEFLQIGKCHLVAAAGGCAFANDYVLSYPDRVRSMVLLSGSGGVTDADYLAIAETLRPKGYEEMSVEFHELGPSYRAANPEGTRQWSEITNKANTGNRRGQPMANKITWAALRSIKVPVLLMTGDADLNSPPAIQRMFAANFPNCELALIPEAGHSSHWEQPETFNRIVLDFIGRH